ncbi:helix-turn-helix transcriptional regulator [Achromobacter sp. F4_2707]|uniref:helix-turn-helix domain-containing protein n=1 Tax=Achromobacter sp. F4_2707 TaxID=3114286 RepID=UPI0039C5F1E1
MSNLMADFARVRQARGMTQAELAESSGLSRMAVQKAESGATDPRLSTLQVMARAMGMELMLVPSALRPDLEQFVQSGGRVLAQQTGVDAPVSVVEDILRRDGS